MDSGNRLRCLCWHMALTICMLTACAQESEKIPLDQVKLQLKWVHQAQFAGFYQAHEKGYYRDENIAVDFLEGGKDVNILTTLVSEKAQFAVASSEMVLMQRQKESAPITAIAVIYRKSAVVYAVKVNSAIKGPANFIGKTAAVVAKSQSHGEFEYQFKALMKDKGFDISRIDLVAYDPSYTKFYSGEVDVTAAYYTGGVVKMRNEGYQIRLIWPLDYGIHFYSDTIITTERIINENPELVERFLRASLKGWREAITFPKEAIEITLRYARIKDHKLQSDMLSAMTPLVFTGKDQIGWMTGEVWGHMYRVLVDQKILDPAHMDLNKVYTMRFLNKIYPTMNNSR